MNIGLYFGTFNPIHVGHLIIANHMASHTNLDQVWLVVSPQNPLKNKDTLLEDYHRLSLVKVAVEDNPKLIASDIEFHLPKPSFTSDTLIYLQEKYNRHHFSLIMGEDNLRTFHKWKNYETILKQHPIYVYPRVAEKENELLTTNEETKTIYQHPHIILCDAPVMKISASFIRKAIKEGFDTQYLLTEPVHKYVTEMHFYEK
ncbi:MAG: nicotinate-nucleotide adenylyltransferase [Vicingus serpentipes]|nr:nicotinate-nucleotide adenylyltransferase [Vicingus serpentipes]